MTRRVLVTGASGFIARALFSGTPAGYELIAASRRPVPYRNIEWRCSPELSAAADWAPVLQGIDSVVHLAGRTRVLRSTEAAACYSENCDGTHKLAKDAIAAGVTQFVFMSTGKVLGDQSSDLPLSEGSRERPEDAYAASKLGAEQALADLRGGIDLTILRPPLVYGPGVKANFLALFSAVARGIPLPLGSIRNRRSLVGVDNLASAIFACLAAPEAAGRTFHVTDGTAISTPDLVDEIARALGTKPRLFDFPAGALEAAAALIGRAGTAKRLTRSLEFDDSAIRSELGWKAVASLRVGLEQTAKWYRETYWAVT
jgi:nucleoside-diphosphate-sugar epimerase